MNNQIILNETEKIALMLIGVSTDYLTGSVDESVLKIQVESANFKLVAIEKERKKKLSKQ